MKLIRIISLCILPIVLMDCSSDSKDQSSANHSALQTPNQSTNKIQTKDKTKTISADTAAESSDSSKLVEAIPKSKVEEKVDKVEPKEQKKPDLVKEVAKKHEPKTRIRTKGKPKTDQVTTSKPSQGHSVKKTPKKGKGKFLVFKAEHKFGFIEEGDSIIYNFEMQNVGLGSIEIMDVEVSCGCTTPNYSFLPIEPGARTSIKVTFDSHGKLGVQAPVVTVITDGDPKKYELTLSGVVRTLKKESPKDSTVLPTDSIQ